MRNFITNGLDWFQRQRVLHTTHEILIGYQQNSAVPILATVSSDDAESTQNRVTLQKQMFHFIVERADLIKYDIKLHRGVKIWYLDDEYELTFHGKDLYEYNDPNRNDVVLKAVLIKDDEGFS